MIRVPFCLLFGFKKGGPQKQKGQRGTTGESWVIGGYPKGPSTQIAGFQGPKTTQGMDYGT